MVNRSANRVAGRGWGKKAARFGVSGLIADAAEAGSLGLSARREGTVRVAVVGVAAGAASASGVQSGNSAHGVGGAGAGGSATAAGGCGVGKSSAGCAAGGGIAVQSFLVAGVAAVPAAVAVAPGGAAGVRGGGGRAPRGVGPVTGVGRADPVWAWRPRR